MLLTMLFSSTSRPAHPQEAKRVMHSQETIPDDTLYQVCIHVTLLTAITDHLRTINNAQSKMIPFIHLRNHQNQHKQASTLVIGNIMSSPANTRRARQGKQPYTSTLVRLSSLSID